jgi:hypothetical protein
MKDNKCFGAFTLIALNWRGNGHISHASRIER